MHRETEAQGGRTSKKAKFSDPGVPIKTQELRTSLVVQRLRLCAPNAGGPVWIPGWGPAFHVLESRFLTLQGRSEIPCATTKMRRSQIKEQHDPWVWKIPWRRAWQPTPVFLPGESHGQRNLASYSLWGCTESDTTEVT